MPLATVSGTLFTRRHLPLQRLQSTEAFPPREMPKDLRRKIPPPDDKRPYGVAECLAWRKT